MIQRRTLVKAVIAALAPLSMTSAFAAGGPSGAHIGYQHQGQLGAVDMNPYKIAPLTAIIRDAGFTIQNIHVRIVPKANGQEIAYKVTNQKAKRMAAFLFWTVSRLCEYGRGLLHQSRRRQTRRDKRVISDLCTARLLLCDGCT